MYQEGPKEPTSWLDDTPTNGGIPVETFLPDYGQYGKSAPLKRNIQIVEASEQLIAFWDGKSRGTSFTIKEARKRDIAVFVMYETQSE